MTTHPAVEAAEAVLRQLDEPFPREEVDLDAVRVVCNALRATLPGLREAGEPVAIKRHDPNIHVVGPSDGGRVWIEELQPIPVGTKLYAAPPSPAPQPDTVPVPTVVSWSGGAAPYRFVRLRLDDTPTEYEYVPAPQPAQGGGEVVAVVTRASAAAALNHLSLHNGPGRLAEASRMLATPPTTKPAADAGVVDMRERIALKLRGMDCAHGCGIGEELAAIVRATPAPAAPDEPWAADKRKPCTCDGAGRGPGRECVVKAGGRLGELWRCAKGCEPVAAAAGLLPPIVRVLAEWEDENGTLAAIMPDEWAELRDKVARACVDQSPRMLRAALAAASAPPTTKPAAEAGVVEALQGAAMDALLGKGYRREDDYFVLPLDDLDTEVIHEDTVRLIVSAALSAQTHTTEGGE